MSWKEWIGAAVITAIVAAIGVAGVWLVKNKSEHVPRQQIETSVSEGLYSVKRYRTAVGDDIFEIRLEDGVRCVYSEDGGIACEWKQ